MVVPLFAASQTVFCLLTKTIFVIFFYPIKRTYLTQSGRFASPACLATRAKKVLSLYSVLSLDGHHLSFSRASLLYAIRRKSKSKIATNRIGKMSDNCSNKLARVAF